MEPTIKFLARSMPLLLAGTCVLGCATTGTVVASRVDETCDESGVDVIAEVAEQRSPDDAGALRVKIVPYLRCERWRISTIQYWTRPSEETKEHVETYRRERGKAASVSVSLRADGTRYAKEIATETDEEGVATFQLARIAVEPKFVASTAWVFKAFGYQRPYDEGPGGSGGWPLAQEVVVRAKAGMAAVHVRKAIGLLNQRKLMLAEKEVEIARSLGGVPDDLAARLAVLERDAPALIAEHLATARRKTRQDDPDGATGEVQAALDLGGSDEGVTDLINATPTARRRQRDEEARREREAAEFQRRLDEARAYKERMLEQSRDQVTAMLASSYGCEERVLRGDIVARLGKNAYEVAPDSIGSADTPTNVILMTNHSSFASEGHVTICVLSKTSTRSVSLRNGFKTTLRVYTEDARGRAPSR